jgi:hypothetical protein
MSTIIWYGDASAVAKVDTLTVGGTIEAAGLFSLTIGNKTLSVTAGSTDAETVATNIVTAFNLLTQTQAPEFYEITAAADSGGAFTLTAKTPGKPFTVTQPTTEAGGGAADDQTFDIAHTVVNAGPNDASTAANYSGGALPTDSDVLVFENSASSVLYNLDALAAITLAELHIRQSYTGWIGLPRTNGSGTTSYLEYRPQYLQVGATAWDIGLGEGNGTGRVKLDFGAVQFAGSVYNGGSQVESYVPAVLLKGTHADNVLTVLKGTVGVAFFTGEVSTLSALNIGHISSVGDSTVHLGDGVTLTTVTKASGTLSVGSDMTALSQYDGTTTVRNAATIGTGIVGGTIIDQSSGTWGATAFTLLANGVYDHSRSLTPKTITNLNGYEGARFLDPYGVVTLTNGLVHSGCKPGKIFVDLPINKTLSFS